MLLTSLPSSSPKELYNPKAFFIHAAWLRQGSPHCAIFPTAASRRSLDRVSVPVWLVILSDQLEIDGLVGHYPTNYLIPLGLTQWQPALRSRSLVFQHYAVLATVSRSYPPPLDRFPSITHPSATRQQRKQAFFPLPFDLHVLSLPPAFNLSHDQTLQFKFNRSICTDYKSSIFLSNSRYIKNYEFSKLSTY